MSFTPRVIAFKFITTTPAIATSASVTALVVSPDIRNRLANDVIVVPVSSVLREAPTHVRLQQGLSLTANYTGE